MKSGYKTTEFWVSLATVVGSVLSTLVGELPDKYAAFASAIASVGYALSRGLTKGGSSQ